LVLSKQESSSIHFGGYESTHLTPFYNCVSQLVYAARGGRRKKQHYQRQDCYEDVNCAQLPTTAIKNCTHIALIN